MKVHLTQSSIVVLAFAVTFAICGARVLLGYPLSSASVFACSILSFFAGIVQVLETIMSFFDKSKERLLEELKNNGLNNESIRKKTETWYCEHYDIYKTLINMIMFISMVVGLCCILFGFEYENNVLSDGLSLLAIATLFLSMVIRDYANARISAYKLKINMRNENEGA